MKIYYKELPIGMPRGLLCSRWLSDCMAEILLSEGVHGGADDFRYG